MKGLKYAGRILRDRELIAWKERRRELYAERQLVYLDSIAPIYRTVLYALPRQARKVLFDIASNYGVPITTKNLADKTRIPYRAAASQISRLKKAGIIKRRKKGYVLTDKDLLRVYAVWWGYEWRNWEKPPDVSPRSVVDNFLEEMQSRSFII